MTRRFHKHIIQVLTKKRVSEQQKIEVRKKFEKLEKQLKPIRSYNPRIYYGGSYKKKTMVKGSYDLDVVIYFPSTIDKTPKELREYVKSVLKAHYSIKTSYGIALLVSSGTLEIDVIVGKAKTDKYKIANAYNVKEKRNMRVSLDIHQQNIAGNHKLIKLMKIWRLKHQLKWHKLAVESYVVRLFDNSNEKDLGECFKRILLEIKSNILSIKFIDPANSNNPILVSEAERRKVKKTAEACLEYLNKEEFSKIV